MHQENATPSIYVACLSAYVNGKLHGSWIDCNQDAEAIWEEINEMLRNSPEPDAEEWAIHDYENWQGIPISETESIERLVQLAELLQEHGKAFAVYCNYCGSDDASAEDFSDHYIGQYESEKDFVYQLWEESGLVKQLEDLGVCYSYIDWESIACDLFINSYQSIDVAYKEVYVFTR